MKKYLYCFLDKLLCCNVLVMFVLCLFYAELFLFFFDYEQSLLSIYLFNLIFEAGAKIVSGSISEPAFNVYFSEILSP